MYCEFFKLHTAPFNNTPDPRFFFSTPDHEEALATLLYATQARKGFVLVTGEVGAGKTLLSRLFIRKVKNIAPIGTITNTHLSGRDLLALICNEFRIRVTPEETLPELTNKLMDFLVEEKRNRRLPILIIDEAQNLPIETFEQLRMISNLETNDAKLLQMVILGQPELAETFRRPELCQLRQRLSRSLHINAMSRQQTGQYIAHRLNVAGASDDHVAFDTDAIQAIYNFSQGVPRLINLVCDNALLSAFAQSRPLIEGDIIDEVVQDLACLDPRRSDTPAISSSAPPTSSEPTPSAMVQTPPEQDGPAIAPHDVSFQDANLRLTLRQAEIAQANLDGTLNKLMEHRAAAERTNAELAKLTTKAEDIITRFETAAADIPNQLDELWSICELSQERAEEFKTQAKASMNLTSAMRMIFQHADDKASTLRAEVERVEQLISKTVELSGPIDELWNICELSPERTEESKTQIESSMNLTSTMRMIFQHADDKASTLRAEIERVEQLISRIVELSVPIEEFWDIFELSQEHAEEFKTQAKASMNLTSAMRMIFQHADDKASTLRAEIERVEQLISEIVELSDPDQLPSVSESMRQLLDHGKSQSDRLQTLIQEAREFETDQVNKAIELSSRITGVESTLAEDAGGDRRLRQLADRTAQLTEAMTLASERNDLSLREIDASQTPVRGSLTKIGAEVKQ